MVLFCVLGDCNKEECHHCFPVKHCSQEHSFCKKHGVCDEIDVTKRIMVTGCAGFIGSHTCERLLKDGYTVLGIDNLNDYYDVSIKERNLEQLKTYERFRFKKEDITVTDSVSSWKPYKVIHLASIAGVRYSIDHPKTYCDVNIKGFVHILEECVRNNVKHVVYASSSSVYGLNTKTPFEETDVVDKCNSPYACSKMAMEMYAKMYTQLYDISCIGLRFFTVYGPRGRPDMAPYKLLSCIRHDQPFEKYGDGSSYRDYTYIDDIVTGIIGAMHNKKRRVYEIYNLGNSIPVTLNEFIGACEKVTGKTAICDTVKERIGDVPHTHACIDKASRDLDYAPSVSLHDGLTRMYQWLSSP